MEDIDGFRQIRAMGATDPAIEQFLLLSRSVVRENDAREYSIKVAFRVNDAGKIIPEPTPTPLAVYFDTEDVTGLHFQVHGPFQLTDNRANVKREDPWNQHLVRELGALVAGGLDNLRDRGLLRQSFLEVMPNLSDELPETWAPLRKVVIEAFQARPLLPTHSGNHVKAANAVRGPADVREALGDDGLEQLGGLKEARWVAGGLRGSRTEAFLSTVKVREFGLNEALDAFRRTFGCSWRSAERIRAEAWFDTLSDDRVQRLYLILDQATRQQRRPGLEAVPFVRLEDGRRVAPVDARLAPSGATQGDDHASLGPVLVRSTILRGGRSRGQDVEQFLRRVGVPEIGERDWLSAILRDHYGPSSAPPAIERHLQHVRRFVRHFEATNERDFLTGVRWLRVEGRDGLCSPSNVFLPPPFAKNCLERVYGGRVAGRDRYPLWGGYARIRQHAKFLEMLVAAGAEDALAVARASPSGKSPLG